MPGKKQPNNQVVVYVPKAPPQQKKKKKKGKKPKQNAMSMGRVPRVGPMDSVQQYALALRDPFDPRVDGVRMPDTYSYATITKKHKVRAALTSDSNGLLAFSVLPSPYFSLTIFNGSGTGITAFPSNPYAAYITSPDTEVSSGLTAHRVVSWGFRIVMTDTNANAKGTYIVAPAPMGMNTFLDWQQLSSFGGTSGYYPTDFIGFPRATAGVETLPHARMFNAQDLMYKGEFRGVGVPYDSSVKDFRPMTRDGSTAYGGGNLFLSGNTGSVLSTVTGTPHTIRGLGQNRTLDMCGNIGYVVYGQGLPASTNEISLEIVYHVEYIPSPTATIVSSFTAMPSPNGTTQLLERIFTGVRDSMYMGDKLMTGTARMLGMAGYAYMRARGGRAQIVD